MPGEGWTKKLASKRFVLDLVEREIINGPAEIDKAAGPGRGRRFQPRDYHDLLELIRFKALGASLRDAWIVRLWLRGHVYPFERVKAALLREIESKLDTVQADFAPTGRWTEPFSVKYDRRIRQRPEDTLYPELIDPMEPIAAHMMRPDVVPEIQLRTESIASTFAEVSQFPETELRELLDASMSAIRSGSIDEGFKAKALGFLQTQLSDEFIEAGFKPDANGRSEVENLFETLHGIYGDGSQAKLTRMLERATEDDFRRAQQLVAGILSGKLEVAIHQALPHVPPDHRQMFGYLCTEARRNRLMMRNNPWVMMLILAEWIISFMAPQKSDATNRVDADSLLRILQERQR